MGVEESTPAGWREVDERHQISEQYQGRSPTTFEYEKRPLLLQVAPSEPSANVAHGEERWAVRLVEGTASEQHAVRILREDVPDEAAAREAAHEVMGRFNEEYATSDLEFERLADRLGADE